MMWRVIAYFEDLQDNSRPYNPGDAFPREGLSVSPERLKELSGPDNRQKRPLIAFEGEAEEVPAEEKKTRSRARKTR